MRNASIAVLREIGVETGGSNVQFAVQPETGRLIVIEMNPRVSPLLRARLQGHRLPHRQDRREARRRLHPRRARQRHHPGHARLLRADHRLRRHQDPPLRLREVPRRRAAALHRDEIRRRGDGHRPHLPRIRAEGALLARDRPHRLRRHRHPRRPRPRLDRQGALPPDPRPPAHRRPGHAPRPLGRRHPRRHPLRPVVPRPHPRDRRRGGAAPPARPAARAPRAAPAQDDGLLRRPPRHADRPQRILGPRRAPAPRRARRLQAHRHLRRRVRGPDPLHVLDLRGRARRLRRMRIPPLGPQQGRHPRRRPQPHRPGHRVRLLLLPRLLRADRRGLRDHHGQLQPRDRLDRLRHLGPALLRAAHPRARPRDPARRAGRTARCTASSSSSAARPR